MYVYIIYLAEKIIVRYYCEILFFNGIQKYNTVTVDEHKHIQPRNQIKAKHNIHSIDTTIAGGVIVVTTK